MLTEYIGSTSAVWRSYHFYKGDFDTQPATFYHYACVSLLQEIADEVAQLKAASGKAPGLAVVLVGSRADSRTYVRSKTKACAEAGVESFGTGNLPLRLPVPWPFLVYVPAPRKIHNFYATVTMLCT